MPAYNYKARDVTGKPIKGVMEAGTKEELVDKLHKLGYMTTEVSEALSTIKVDAFFDKFKRIGMQELIVFYVQFSNMLNAGIDILFSLKTLANQTVNKRLREVINGVLKSIQAGDSLSIALSGYPKVFPFIFISMVKAGEVSGKLGMVLSRFAQFIEHQEDLRQKIKGVMFYPLLLLFAGIGVVLFIATFIIPKFTEIFLKAHISLPLPTIILNTVGIGIKKFWYLGILFIILCAIAIRYYARTTAGRFNLDSLKLKLPLFGDLYRKAAVSRFSRTLATLVESGVPILQSLDITKDVIGNEVLSHIIKNVRESVEKGEKISESLKISGEFPSDIVQMISVGEETGDLSGMLNKVSDFYDMTLNYSIKRLVAVLEPLLLVIMAVMIGFIMASMLLPMFDMIKTLRH
ncbi:MAG: type II secretion system F family protein [Candidatus Omnitrophota bacterium]|jgi:type IV pilus assembly protein PilC